MKLYRPHIPLFTRCEVALRQIGWSPETAIDIAGKADGCGLLLKETLIELSSHLKCEVSDLRLDHDPALGARVKRGEGRNTAYTPDANDPDFLRYRPHGPQFDGSHDVKTRIRGDHGQYSDIVLIKRERRRLAKKKTKPKKRRKISTGRARRNSSGFPNRPAQVKRDTDSGVKLRPVKRKWPSRPFQNRNKP